ncbi:hypothetical protein OSTOST_17619 [Ostertagia ostertagi]
MTGFKIEEENDLNKNGGISFREFTPFVLKLMNVNRAELERLFLAGDIDRNSELDGEECIPMRSLLKSTLREKSELMLKNRDQMISAGSEMTDLMMNLRSRALSNGQATLSVGK